MQSNHEFLGGPGPKQIPIHMLITPIGCLHSFHGTMAPQQQLRLNLDCMQVVLLSSRYIDLSFYSPTNPIPIVSPKCSPPHRHPHRERYRKASCPLCPSEPARIPDRGWTANFKLLPGLRLSLPFCPASLHRKAHRPLLPPHRTCKEDRKRRPSITNQCAQ